jgi:hypothetical protein
MMPPGGRAGGWPDAADGSWSFAEDPAGEGGLEDLGAETTAEVFYRSGESGDRLIHGAGSRVVRIRGVFRQSRDTRTHGVCLVATIETTRASPKVRSKVGEKYEERFDHEIHELHERRRILMQGYPG